jgi:hypothetical protein
MPENLPSPPPRLRDLVARPRPFPLRTVILVALVPLVGFTIFVIATHHDSPPVPPKPTPSSAQPPGVIFVTPVSAPTAKASE